MGKVRDASKERYWRKLIRRQRETEETVARFCARQGVAVHQFYGWQPALRDGDRPSRRAGIVEAIKRWLDERDQQELPRSPLRQALNYLRNRWEAFERFLENGAIRLDNNGTEAALKGPVMGKTAWLFFRQRAGARNGGHSPQSDDHL